MRRLPAAAIALVALLAVLSLAALDRYWSRLPAPSSGGSDLSVELPDRVHFQQNDPGWATERLGGTGDDLSSAGCTVASVAMAMTNLGHLVDPRELNAKLTSAGGFTDRGWLVWDAIARVTNGALRAETHGAPSLAGVDRCLARGAYPVVKFLLGGAIQHWVVLVGKRDGEYRTRDPLIDAADPIPLSRRTPVILSVRCIGKA